MPEQITQLTPRQIYMRAYCEKNKEKLRAYYEANKTQIADYQRAWHEANKEARKEKNRDHYEANKTLIAEKKRAYHQANKEKIRAWSANNKERIVETRRAWLNANPEKVQNATARRILVPGAITSGWIQKLLELQRWTCIVCLKDLRYGYHIDHLYPVSKSGLNTDYNLQALCPKCNLEKSDKDPIDYMQSRGFLL